MLNQFLREGRRRERGKKQVFTLTALSPRLESAELDPSTSTMYRLGTNSEGSLLGTPCRNAVANVETDTNNNEANRVNRAIGVGLKGGGRKS